MTPALRRIIAVEAHRRATGRCAHTVHALGTGESFAVVPKGDGFLDAASGIAARLTDGILHAGAARVLLVPQDNVLSDGVLLDTGARFSLRAGGGSSVTVYAGAEWFQYALVTD